MKRVIDSERIPIKLWLDDIEEGALAQARNLANLPFAYKWIAIMPDSHEGFGMPIGGVMATEGVIVPNAVGVDIGCGMTASRSSLASVDTDALKQIMGMVRKAIPVGFAHHQADQEWEGFDEAPDIEVIQQELKSAHRQLGTLGGGNHFIEFQQGDDGRVWVMVHSGSRNFGLKVATEYHKKAVALCEKWHSEIPDKDLAFLPMDTKEGKEYSKAMNYCLSFAKANRDLMIHRIQEIVAKITGASFDQPINIHHNYAAYENHFGKNVIIHRKGATKATEGLVGIIPGSMGTASYVVEGLGSEESFSSCSHGAGRRMGRREAIRSLDLAQEQEKMKDVIGGPRSQNELDEAPGAYKDIDQVMANQADLVRILVTLRPLASIKG